MCIQAPPLHSWLSSLATPLVEKNIICSWPPPCLLAKSGWSRSWWASSSLPTPLAPPACFQPRSNNCWQKLVLTWQTPQPSSLSSPRQIGRSWAHRKLPRPQTSLPGGCSPWLCELNVNSLRNIKQGWVPRRGGMGGFWPIIWSILVLIEIKIRNKTRLWFPDCDFFPILFDTFDLNWFPFDESIGLRNKVHGKNLKTS